MFQPVVADPIPASPNSKAFGRLSILSQWRAEPRIQFNVPPEAFTPPPKVTSSVVRITPAEQPEGIDPERLESLTAAAFNQRRKMLRQSLRGLMPDPSGFLESCGGQGFEQIGRAH